METTEYYIREQIYTQFIPKKVHGLVYPTYAIVEGHTYHTAAKMKTTDFPFGPILNMYISGDELLPIPKSKLKANSDFMLEILNTKSEIKRYLDKAIENIEILWKKSSANYILNFEKFFVTLIKEIPDPPP